MYNNYVMDKKTPNLWFLRTALGLMLLIGLSPISHILSMQTRHMRMTSETGAFLNSVAPAGQDMPAPCCNDTFGSSSSICGSFVIPHSACATHSAGTHRVALSLLFIQISYREIVTPPPKV